MEDWPSDKEISARANRLEFAGNVLKAAAVVLAIGVLLFLVVVSNNQVGEALGMPSVSFFGGMCVAVLSYTLGMVICGQVDQIRLALRVANNTQALLEIRDLLQERESGSAGTRTPTG
jgi:hypothetical protein